ncbi:MAG: M16 family metallopeptidase [Armatimonadota bacterium]
MMTLIARCHRTLRSAFARVAARVRAPLAACIAAGLIVASVSGAAATVLDPRAIQSETFANGLRLIVASESDSPVVSVEIIVKAGSADEPPEARGVAHLLEHVLWTGAAGENNDPRLRVEAVGGVINAGTLRDFTRFYATVPAGRLELAIEALREIVLDHAVDPSVVARERQVIVQESAARQDNPAVALNDAAFAVIFGDSSPYGSPIEGTVGGLASAEAATLSLFRERYYVPNNIAVVVAGHATFADAHRAVERAFGQMRPSPVPGRAGAVEGPRSSGEHAVDLPVRKAYVMAAFPGPGAADHSQVAATDLLATLLAHDPLGRLVAELRERRGIADQVGVDFLTQRDRSLFGVWAVCDPPQVGEVKSAIQAELQRLARQPVPADELARARKLLAAGYSFANETPADRASTLAFYEAIDSYRSASYYLSWVQDISAQALISAARQYGSEPTWIVLAPGSAEP